MGYRLTRKMCGYVKRKALRRDLRAAADNQSQRVLLLTPRGRSRRSGTPERNAGAPPPEEGALELASVGWGGGEGQSHPQRPRLPLGKS